MADKASEKPAEKVEAATESTAPASSALKSATSTGAESPRTVREADALFDADDEVPEAHLPAPERSSTPKKRVSFQDEHDEGPVPPPKPPRPLSPKAQAEQTLIEAFPSMDAKVIKAVLVASGGKVEPAFNALLSMSDPDFQETAPPPPPRKTMSQIERDELYARQLAEQYESSYEGFGSRGRGNPPLPRRSTGQSTLNANDMHGEKEHSFLDDDLPVIQEKLTKTFNETKSTVNKWWGDFQKKLDGDESMDPIPRPGGRPQPPRNDFGPSQSNQIHGIRKNAESSRRSGEHDRYDADPQVLADDFGHRLELREDETPPARQARGQRPLANPNLFKQTQTSGDGQESGIMAGSSSSSPMGIGRKPSPAQGSKAGGKWQPLTSVEPTSLDDHDPFSLGDSDDDYSSSKTGSKASESKKDADKEDTKVGESSVTKPAQASKAGESSSVAVKDGKKEVPKEVEDAFKEEK
ncbi:hypothetical protein BT63DRAFT_422856 [Microthyrium microscopicum]|uniref:CUE domain-containing protein n=1 Tax=Microthyrium microscopicum TaxID=703497 RepID=A0A6A6UJH5_9PEZI|nr:hypothetical protein BT63DRAFT_422856 [Microthyrium microscopicum]